MDEALQYDKKVKDMQKFIPFLENLITKLEKSKEKSRETQLTKMRMLYGLLTKKDKKLKLDTLLKCESVLEKLYKKVEKNLGDCDAGVDKKPVIKPIEKTERLKETAAIEELSAPSSPQNLDASVEFHAPIVIPTERKNSPTSSGSYRNKDKNSVDKNRNVEKQDRHGSKNGDSRQELYRRRSPSRYDQSKGSRYSDKSSHSSDRYDGKKDRSYDEDRHHSDRSSRPYDKNSYFERRTHTASPSNERSPSNENKHTANAITNTNANSGSSTPESNSINTSTNRTIVSPTPEAKNRDTIFQRLGTKLDVSSKDNYENFKIKITNDKLKKKRAPTPLFEVLQSPPLSANDIDDLLNESGAKADKDEKKDLSDLEAVRKKLSNEIGICKKKAKKQSAATREHHGEKSSDKDSSASKRESTKKEHHSSRSPSARSDSSSTSKANEHSVKESHSTYTDSSSNKSRPQEQPEKKSEKSNDMTGRNSSDKQMDSTNVRLAYKYNPHPRRSTESSKFEEPIPNIAKPSDPRVNRSTMNTLPSVNLADPRLRNRPILPVPPPNILDVNMSRPAFSSQDVRRPVRPIFPIFPGFQQPVAKPVPPPIPMPSQMIHSVPPQPVPPPSQISNQVSHSVSMANQITRPLNACNQPPSLLSLPIRKPADPIGYNKFRPMMNDQSERMKYMESKKNRCEPKTYGEYRQAKLGHHVDKNIFEPHKSPIPRRESIDIQPNCLDKMYRKSDFKNDVPSVSSFKIPKVAKPKCEEVSKDKRVESDEDSVSSKDSGKDNKKLIKQEDKKDKSKSHSGSSSERDKIKSEKTESKKDKPKSSDSSKSERSEGKNKIEERKKEAELEKTKTKLPSDVPKKSAKDEPHKKKDKQEKTESTSEKKEIKTVSEPASSKKTTTEPKELKLKEESIDVAEHDSSNNNDDNVDSSLSTAGHEKSIIEISDAEDTPSKIKLRRRKSICEILPSTTDGSEISTQNIITGKRRTRSVLPPPSEVKAPEPKATTVKRKSRPKGVVETVKQDVDDVVKSEEKPEAKQLKSEVKVEPKEDSEACAVSSTTANSVEESHSSTTEPGEIKKDEPKTELTKEWLEGFLLNIFNPTMVNKHSVLNMLEKVLDEKKFKQIKEIVDESSGDEKEKAIETKTTTSTEEPPNETPSEEKKLELDSEEPKNVTEHKKKHKTELDRLNEDIRDMFISQGVLTATGRRMCTIINEVEKIEPVKEPQHQKPKPATKNSQKAQCLSTGRFLKAKNPKNAGKSTAKNTKKRKDGRGRPKGSFKNKRVLPNRGAKTKQTASTPDDENESENVNYIDIEDNLSTDDEPLLNRKRSRSVEEIPDKDNIPDNEMPVLEAQTPIKTPEKSDDDMNETLQEPKPKKRYKPCPKSKRKVQYSDDESENDIESRESSAKKTGVKKIVPEKVEEQAEIIIEEDKTDFMSTMIEPSNSEFSTEDNESPKQKSPSKSPKKDKGGRGLKKAFWGTGTESNILFKNIDPNVHVKSVHVKKCILCGFVGRRMCNHYVHAHPNYEVPTSRLPQDVLEKLKAGMINHAIFAYKRVDNNTVYQYQCPFCDVRSSLSRRGWIDHFGTHTGEYAFKCSDCSRFLNLRQMIQKHIKHSCPNGRIISLREVDKDRKRVTAYVCELCNYLQMNRKAVVKHLKTEHDEENDLIIAVPLINWENTPRADNSKRAEIVEENKESRRSQCLKYTGDQIEAYIPKDDDINMDPNFLNYIRGMAGDCSSQNSSSIADQIRETEDELMSASLGMFQHSIFNDMTIVDRLSERLTDDLNKQIQNHESSGEILTSNKNLPSVVDRSTTEENQQISDVFISEAALQNPDINSQEEELPSKQNESTNSDSMVDRLCQRFNAPVENESEYSNSLSMAERLRQRFSNSLEQGKTSSGTATNLGNNTQSVMYIVDRIDEQIANAEHVKAAEIKVPNSECENSLTLSDILSERFKENEPSELATTSGSNGDSTTSLVERIKMRLNTGKSDYTSLASREAADTRSASITERLSERLQQTSTFPSPEKAIALGHSTPKARMSIVERLSKRLNSTAQDQINTEMPSMPEEDTNSEITASTPADKVSAKRAKKSSNDADSSFEGDLIIDEERRASTSKRKQNIKSSPSVNSSKAEAGSITDVATTTSSQTEADNETIEIQSDDTDDWEDIEIITSESMGDAKRQDKPKNNKLIFETFSRLCGLNSPKNKSGSSKKERNSKKGQKGLEKIPDKVPANDAENSLRISSIQAAIIQKEIDKITEIDPLALPAEELREFSVLPISKSSKPTSNCLTNQKVGNNSIENDPLALPTGIEGQFNSLGTSIVSLPSANTTSTVISSISQPTSTISNALSRDLGDISSLLGLNHTNPSEVDPLAQSSDPLDIQQMDVSALNSTIIVLSDQSSQQNAVNLVTVLDNNLQSNNSGQDISNPVDAVATGSRKTGFEVVQSNNVRRQNGTAAKNQNSTEEGDSCSNAVSSSDPNAINSAVIHRIDKLGYSKSSENLFKYHCLVESCSFLYSELPIGLQNHFMTEHGGILWEGYCYSCEANVCNDESMSLSREYGHMLEVHVKTSLDTIKGSDSSSKPPLIKLRRLSGDILSASQEQQDLENEDFERSVLQTASLEPFSEVDKNAPKLHNRTSEPKKVLPPLKVTTKTSIIKVPNKSNSNLIDNKSMLDAYLVRNNVPNLKQLVLTHKDRSGKNSPLFLNNSTTSNVCDLKIASVAQNVNQDLIHQQSSTNEPFLKISEVISLSTSAENVKPSSSITTTTAKAVSVASTIPSPVLTTVPSVMQIQVSTPSESVLQTTTSSSSTTPQTTCSLVMKPVSKTSSNLELPAGGSALKIQSVTSLTGSNQSLVPSVPKSTDKSTNENMSAKLLKPWIVSFSTKSKAVVEKLLREVSLFCLFKCMGHECSFTTNSAQIMMQHLKGHNDILETLKQTDEGVKNSWRECPYCTERQITNKCLVDHIVHAHGKDIYQCPYCFYRSCVDHNVIVHINTFHRGREKTVLVCFGEQRRLSSEIRDLAKFRTNNVRPMNCYICFKSFYILRNYVKHIKEHNPICSVYKCFACYTNVFKHQAEKHLLAKHNIGVYECIYCLFATEHMDMMRVHMANWHPSCLSYMCVRLSPNKNFDSTEETLESSTVLANLAESVDEKFLRRCQFTQNQLNIMNPSILKPGPAHEKSIVTSAQTSVTPVACMKSKDLEIASVQTISTEIFDHLEDNSKMPPVETAKPDNVQSPFPSSAPQPTQSSSSPTIHYQPTNEEMQMPSETDIASREKTYMRILEAAKEMVQSTGFQAKDLYKCAECGVSVSVGTAMAFHLHVQKHINEGLTDLKCFHCSYVAKNLLALKNHLKVHCIHRYFCYFCNYTGPTSYNLIKHISDSHSKFGMVTFPLIFGHTNKSLDFFVICPKNIKQIEIIQFGERMVRAWERKKALTKKYFTPDEIDLLPRQAIFFNEVHCQVCDYRTKVRTNMFRHLQLHKQEVKVASVDPVNPVPCLNSNERHFDKMLNLACSSNINKDRGAVPKEEPKVPEFVPSMKRYVCGVPGCTYLTISENMMKWHLSALHSNEKTYICPHCSAEVCKKSICAERILAHLKFHDAKLFLCSVCDYMHHQKHIVERHINEKHPTGSCSIVSYERNGTDTIKSTEPVSGRKIAPVEAPPAPPVAKEDEMKWECGLCRTKRPTYNQMVCHMNRAHEVKNRYQCVHCDFGGAQVTNIVVHVAEKHPTKVKEARCMFYKVNENPAEQQLAGHTTPIWTRDPCRVKNIRGILMEDEEESQRNMLHDDTYEEDDESCVSNSEAKTNTTGQNLPTQSVSNSTAGPKTYSSNKKVEVSLACDECSYLAKAAVELQQHMRTFNHRSLTSETSHYVFFCFHCMQKISSIAGMKKHWIAKHQVVRKGRDDALGLKDSPFWFKMSPQVMCGRCSFKNEINTVLKHHQFQHSGTRLAIVNLKDPKKCSQCSYEFKDLDDLASHFQTQHAKLTTPHLSLTDYNLECVLKQGYSQKLIKCLKCKRVPVINESFNDHHNNCHAFTAPSYEYVQGNVLYLCTQCNFVSDEETILRHMYTHSFNCTYKCFSCDSKFKIFADFVEHLDKAHKSSPNQTTVSKCVENKIKQLNEIRVIFPNGLIIEKTQLAGTKYGDNTLIANIAKEEFAQYMSPSKPELDEPESAYNSESESLNSSVTTISRSDKIKKKRPVSATRAISNIDKYRDEDEWKPKAKTKKKESNSIKESIKISKEEKVEKKPEKVDLSKIYTTMTIGGGEVPISCDSFAKLVKINARVKLERIDISKYLTSDPSVSIGKKRPKTSRNEPNKKQKTS